MVTSAAALKAAVEAAAPGDTVTIDDGTYTSWGTCLIQNAGGSAADITVQPQTPGGAEFADNSSFFVLEGCTRVVFKDCIAHTRTSAGGNMFRFEDLSNDCYIDGWEFHGCGVPGDKLTHLLFIGASGGSWTENCGFRNCLVRDSEIVAVVDTFLQPPAAAGRFTTVSNNEFRDLEMPYFREARILIGAISGGPFLNGEDVTGSVSGVTKSLLEGAANGADTLLYDSVGSGNFVSGETLTGQSSGAQTTTQGSPDGSPRWPIVRHGGHEDFYLNNTAHTVVDNLFLRCKSDPDIVHDKASGSVFSRNRVIDCDAAAFVMRQGTDYFVERNEIFNCANSFTSGLVRCIGPRGEIRNNLIYNATGAGLDNMAIGVSLEAGNGVAAAGNKFPQCDDCIIEHNTILGLSGFSKIRGGPNQSASAEAIRFSNDWNTSANGANRLDQPRSCDVRFNVIWLEEGTAVTRATGSPDPTVDNTIDLNLYFMEGTASVGSFGGTNQVLSDPLFVDPTAPGHDYHIQSGSPAQDAATGSTVTEDHDGNTRPQGAASDLGAFEIVAARSGTKFVFLTG